jgi:hypothetical protein
LKQLQAYVCYDKFTTRPQNAVTQPGCVTTNDPDGKRMASDEQRVRRECDSD